MSSPDNQKSYKAGVLFGQQQYLFHQRAGTSERQSSSKLTTILRTTKEKTKNRKEKLRYKHLDKPVSTSLYSYHIITRAIFYA